MESDAASLKVAAMLTEMLPYVLAGLCVLAGLALLLLLRRQRRLGRERETLSHELDDLRRQLNQLHRSRHTPSESAPSFEEPPRPFVVPDPVSAGIPDALAGEPESETEKDSSRPTENDLAEELTSRLQGAGAGGEAPQRYRHVVSLVERGMSAEEISEVLHISLAEAEQLIALSRVAR